MNAPWNPNAKPGVITHFGRWLFSWRTIRRALIVLAGLITLVAIFVTEENWRARRAWQSYKREQEVKGEYFTMASIVPQPVRDAENFFKAPIVEKLLAPDPDEAGGAAPLYDVKPADRIDISIYRGDSDRWPTNTGSWQRARLSDLTQWQRYFRSLTNAGTNVFPTTPQPQKPAADVLLASRKFDSTVQELRAASQRPYARLPLDYENGFQEVGRMLPALSGLKRCTQMLQLRTLAELQNDQSQDALEDVKLMLHLANSLRNEPFLIAHLVRLALFAITTEPIYEGLAQHRWSDAQLADLEAELAKFDFLADYEYAMRGERICGIETIENQRITRQMQSVVPESGTNRIITVSLRLMPSAFFYQNELSIVRLHDSFIRPLVDLTNRIVSPAVERKCDATVNEIRKRSIFAPYTAEALMAFPAISKTVMKFAFAQTSVDLARIACALDRYRLVKGGYPESLDVLAPQFIDKVPHDVIDGKPLHYRRTDDGKFVLYSVGWNEKDDKGAVVLSSAKVPTVDNAKGDWVWKYPDR